MEERKNKKLSREREIKKRENMEKKKWRIKKVGERKQIKSYQEIEREKGRKKNR